MTKTMWFRALIALLSAGWLAPMWLGVATMLDFVELELWPLLLQQPKLNSFPFIDFAGKCFAVAFLWLGLALVGWAWVAATALQRTKDR
jgi:hypothetical protein